MNEENEKPSFFVSRRGRQVGVHEVDMAGINIDTPSSSLHSSQANTDSVPPSTPKTSNIKQVKKASSGRNPWSKRKKLIILSIVLSILIIPVIVAELVTAQYSGATSSAKDDMTNLIASTIIPTQKKAALSADDIRSISGSVNTIASQMCFGGLVDNMAKLYPRAKSAHDECKQTQNKYISLSSSLYNLEGHARYLQKVGTIIKPISTPITDEYAVLEAQQTMWMKTSEDFKKLDPPDELMSTHTELVTRFSSVASNWSKLIAANGSQNKTEFEEAEKALTVEYEAIRSISSQYMSVLNDAQTKVLTAYNATK